MHKKKNYSISEENYLKGIFALSAKPTATVNKTNDLTTNKKLNHEKLHNATKHKEEENDSLNCKNRSKKVVALTYKTVSTSALAEKMQLRNSSITNMLKKLQKSGLIEYTPYQGVRLSNIGKEIALRTLRKHRLWETFLYEKLHFNWQEVHEIAEQLEHIKSPTLIDRLEKLLGFPHFDPHGDPIPDNLGNIHLQENFISLTNLKQGESGTIKRIVENADDLLAHLDEIGLNINTTVKMLSANAFDNSFKISIVKNSTNNNLKANNTSEKTQNKLLTKQKATQVLNQSPIFISSKVAKLIIVAPF